MIKRNPTIKNKAFVHVAVTGINRLATISFVLYESSHSPDIQEKLRAEINETIEKCGGELTYDGLLGMKNLTMILEGKKKRET